MDSACLSCDETLETRLIYALGQTAIPERA
jgi:hypothetical protein